MSKKMRATLKDIARHFPTAIVSGRCIDKLCEIGRTVLCWKPWHGHKWTN
ncbi:hypothetical protein SESBI_11599 [Sesbania bispinosa]|nr:hypothetical protein SESBI_11599 [Sesbania bispinosa]